MKRMITLLLVCTLLFATGFTLSANTAYFSDETGEILSTDLLQIQAAFEELSQTYGTPIYGALEYSEATDDTEAYQLSEAKLREMSGKTDGIIFYVDLTTRQWDISAFGAAQNILTNDVLDLLEEEIQEPLENGNYGKAFRGFASQMEYVLSLEKAKTPYKAPINWVASVIWALVVGFAVAGICVWVMASKLKSVHRQSAARSYLRQDSLNITESRDLFLYRTVTRTPRPKESSSSSSGRSNGSVGRSGRF